MKSDKNMSDDTIKTKSMGRPRKELDENIIANLSQIGCTQEEIGSVVGTSARTLQRRYADLIEENKNKGKASLRKKMWERALKGDPKMLIWLSKNYLNMVDKVHTTSTVEPLPLIIEAKAEDVNG
jgi:hypothetical protein